LNIQTLPKVVKDVHYPHRKEFLGGDVPRNGPREESDVKAFSTEYLVDAARIARRELVDQARI